MSKTILVLGGGGVKGMTQAGAWRALQEAGIQVSEIVGTSIGALVGACIGAGQTWDELSAAAVALKKADIVLLNRWALLLNGIRQPSLFQSEPLLAYIESVLPVTRFSELAIPVSMNAVDLETGDVEWFGAGGRTDLPLSHAVYASCALPLFYPPAEIENRYFVDGGVLDALPIDRAAARGADLIIAIDAGAGKVRESLDTVNNGLVAIHHRVMEITGWERKRAMLENWRGPRLVYVRPLLDGFSTFDFGRTSYFLEEGYRATKEALIREDLARS
ncbi:MAG TPA: patatin-like phospholipase family protein [Longimicrobiales bacterium]